jgi:hypothetical protein
MTLRELLWVKTRKFEAAALHKAITPKADNEAINNQKWQVRIFKKQHV